MAYQTRWKIPFKDIQQNLHYIYIQTDGWEGEETTLIGGSTPIDWDEESSDSLLTRIRYKTGHIEVVEEYSGQLVDIFPTTSKSHRIIIPGMFWGYIKPQTSLMPWCEYPRILKLNIVSPLALAPNIDMGTDHGPGDYLNTVFDSIMTLLESEYIIVPTGSGSKSDFMNGIMNGRLIAPYSQEKAYQMNTEADAYAPISVTDTLKLIADTHDLTIYDAVIGSSPVLMITRFAGGDNYWQWSHNDVSSEDWDNGTHLDCDSLIDIFSLGTIASNDNSEKLISPYRAIDVFADGEIGGSQEWPTWMSKVSGAYLTPLNWLNILKNTGIQFMSINDNGSVVEVVSVFYASQSDDDELFSVKFRNVEFMGYHIRVKFATNHSPSSPVKIKVSHNQYSDIFVIDPNSVSNGEWESTTSIYIEESATITFMSPTAGINQTYYVETVELSQVKDSFPTGREKYTDRNYIKTLDGVVGENKLEYRIPLNNRFQSNHYTTDLVYSNDNNTLYPCPSYLLVSQTMMIVTIRTIRTLTAVDYLQKYYVDNSGRRWRIVAIKHDPIMCIAKISLISANIL